MLAESFEKLFRKKIKDTSKAAKQCPLGLNIQPVQLSLEGGQSPSNMTMFSGTGKRVLNPQSILRKIASAPFATILRRPSTRQENTL